MPIQWGGPPKGDEQPKNDMYVVKYRRRAGKHGKWEDKSVALRATSAREAREAAEQLVAKRNRGWEVRWS
jgi:hypothetical protein